MTIRHSGTTAVAWLFVAPAVAGLLVFLVVPCVVVVIMAFTDWRLGHTGIGFAGLANFRELLGDRVFWNSAGNTVTYALLVTPISVGLGVWLAVAVESSTVGRAFFSSAFFLPVVSTTVAMAIVWEFLLHPTLGPLAAALRRENATLKRLLDAYETRRESYICMCIHVCVVGLYIDS